MYKQRCNGILKNQQEDVKQENYSDNFNEYHQNVIYLSGMSHIQEYTEYIDRQQGQNHRLDGLDYDFFEIVTYVFQRCTIQCAMPRPSVKAKIKEVITFITGGMATVKNGEISCASLICSIGAPGVIMEGKKVTPVK